MGELLVGEWCRLYCKCVQWNLFITDTLVQGSLSVIKRCPLLGGWFKNASVTHIKYYYNVMKYI